MPDHAWAVDARTGREVWHYSWTSHGGEHIGNRGVGVYGNWLYFLTPDCNIVSLNLKDGVGALAEDSSAISISITSARWRRWW